MELLMDTASGTAVSLAASAHHAGLPCSPSDNETGILALLGDHLRIQFVVRELAVKSRMRAISNL